MFTIKKLYTSQVSCPDCLDPFDCEGTSTFGSFSPISAPGGAGSSQFELSVPPQRIGGSVCEGTIIGNAGYAGCPIQAMKLNAPLPCNVVDNSNVPIGITTSDFMSELGVGANPSNSQIARYYNYFAGTFPYKGYSTLPNQQTNLKIAKVELEFGTSTYPSRVMVLSGYNRYNYIGPLATSCTGPYRWSNLVTEGQEPNYLEDFVGLSAATDVWTNGYGDNPDLTDTWPTAGGTITVPLYGIIKLERSIKGQYPLSDDTMQFPLFGYYPYDNPTNPGSCCKNSPCNTPSCFSCLQPDIGEPLSSHGYWGGILGGAVIGPWNFSPYNPDSHLGKNGEQPAARIQVPICSVYSLLWSLRNYAIAYAKQNNLQVNSYLLNWGGANNNNANGMSASGMTGNPPWYSIDPGDNQPGVDGPPGVKRVLEDMRDSMPGSNSQLLRFKVPQLFLYDREAYEASPNWQRWQHIYVPGNLNVLIDTGCVNTNRNSICQLSKKRGFFLDNSCHDANSGGANTATILGMPSCESIPTLPGLLGFGFSMRMLGCTANPQESPYIYWFNGFTGGNSESQFDVLTQLPLDGTDRISVNRCP